MLLLISPAKTLDYQTPVPAHLADQSSAPQFIDQATLLMGVLKRKKPRQVAALMDLSDDLAALNVGRYAAWAPQADEANSKPAALAFNGDVYNGLQAASLSAADMAWAQSHLVILSGLYGLLRPMDRLQPHRLEMGTALVTRRGKDLYAFWGDRLVRELNARQADQAQPVVINLASQEYFRSVRRKALRARVVDCRFEDWQGGQYKVISFFAKRARGLMARWAIQQRLAEPQALSGFAEQGYAHVASASSPDSLAFRRRGD